MGEIVSIQDNDKREKAKFLPNHLDDLSLIEGRSIKKLCEKTDNVSLLVFPDCLGAYGDRIGESTIVDFRGDSVCTGNLMGFVGCNQTMLRIHSRFDTEDNDFFMHYLLEKVLSINLFDFQYSTDFASVFDFILFLFPFFLNKALKQGLYKEYVTYQRNDDRVRGVIDISRHIRLNIPFSGKVAYKSREFTADNDLMELVRHTIEYIRSKEFGAGILSRNEGTKDNIALVVDATPAYEKRERGRVIGRNLRSKIHPFFSEYEPLRRLCLQILRQEEIKYGHDDDTIYGVLFDGAWLWEEYLYTILPHPEFRHPENRKGLSHGFKPFFLSGKGQRYPDFYSDSMILDAKYKRYEGRTFSDISSEDIAQVVSYMHVQKVLLGGFLVPGKGDLYYEEETLRGYGGDMFILGLPIPETATPTPETTLPETENPYDKFCRIMSENEKKFLHKLNEKKSGAL